MESQKKHSRSFSFEFFPPKTPEGVEKLRAARRQLEQLKPRFFSVTYGAGGSTRDRTLETVLETRAEGFEAAPHLSCIGSTRADIAQTLDLYQAQGIRHIIALRGDLPSGAASAGELRYANELVEFIRVRTGDWFSLEVACYPEFHPQARSAGDDLRNFKRKVDAGASAAITQYFYNADAYFASSTTARRSASISRSCPASCRSPTSASSRASRTPAAPRSRAGSASSSRASPTTRPRSAASASTSSPSSATGFSPRARPACTSTP
jgi:5,10-methylenetetrahydrofolate reductase